MADDLVTFLRARLDETERIARDAPLGPWMMDDAGSIVDADGHRVILAVGGALDGRVSRWPEGPVVAHIARHDPARVLADVEAKRRIVGRHHDFQGWCAGCGNDLTYRTNDCPELRDLASVYADHPDYREEWRP